MRDRGPSDHRGATPVHLERPDRRHQHNAAGRLARVPALDLQGGEEEVPGPPIRFRFRSGWLKKILGSKTERTRFSVGMSTQQHSSVL